MGCNCGNKTKTVVSTVPTTTTELCSCGKPKSDCGKGTCGCNHEQKPCLEDHSVTLVESVFTTTVTATDTWVMPAVDDCVQLHLKDVTNILPGSILWNKSVGYLHVSSYDASSGYVTACNEGEDGNAEVGSTFPSCMSFHVGIPTQCNCDDGYTGACLAADVTSPGVGETTEVSVTTVSGLFIGDIIDIAGYMYKITAITDINTITVKNEGFGAPIGTVIKNDPNCTGKPCTVKITVVNSDDPCTKDPVNEGVIIVCDEGERKPFAGTADSQIAVWDNEVKKWKLRTVKLENECTNLTADLTLDPLVTLYLITVEDTSIFEVGKTVYLDNRKFKVNSIVNATQMRIQIDKAPRAIKVVEEGAAICKGDCCEDLVIPEMPDLPAKYSGVDSDGAGSNIMRFTIINNNLNVIVEKQSEWSSTDYQADHTESLTNKLPSITIANPTNIVNGKKLTIVGTITVSIEGQFRSDTHTSRSVSNDNDAANYPYLSLIYGPGAELSIMPKLNGTNLFSDRITSYRQYFVNTDKFTADPAPGNVQPYDEYYSRSVTLPICCTITKGSSNTITLDGTITGYNLRNKGGASTALISYVNNKVRITVDKIQTTVALAWIIQ